MVGEVVERQEEEEEEEEMPGGVVTVEVASGAVEERLLVVDDDVGRPERSEAPGEAEAEEGMKKARRARVFLV